MGAKVSKADVLNEVLNNVAVSVMVSTTSSGTSQISQSNTIDASGSENANVSKNIQTNIAKVNLSMISTTTQMSDIQSKLEAELKNAITQKQKDIGLFSGQESKLANIIKNNVEAKVNLKSVSELKTTIDQKNAISAANSTGAVLERNKQQNKADAVLKMISEMNSSIIADLQTHAIVDNKTMQENTNPISDFFDGLGIAMIVFIALALGGVFLLSKVPSLVNKKTIALLACIALVALSLVSAKIIDSI